ncbi:unnamed protein product [Caenorhabditis auriculariae]|uniref:Uncharacterized protein n=1 Tax=Caenorhabditis auriculariae TaxID=2777116 RepID=A0A8S1GW49_9PELO|nr:unnamed protein product [Caenorhabditis auriculariae]
MKILNFYDYQKDGNLVKGDRSVVDCVDYCVSLKLEGDSTNELFASCANSTIPLLSCDDIGCRKGQADLKHSTTCCCNTPLCNNFAAAIFSIFGISIPFLLYSLRVGI